MANELFIRNVPAATRDAVKRAAAARGITLGELLTRYAEFHQHAIDVVNNGIGVDRDGLVADMLAEVGLLEVRA